MFNTTENFNMIKKEWNRFTHFPKLTFIFVNMYSSNDQKWFVKPFFHERITEKKSLKKGLQSMFKMIDAVTKEDFAKKSL